MADQSIIKKLADIPLNRPGFDSLGISAPVLIQMNPYGKWENCKPANMDEDKLRAVVQHLVNSNAVSAAQSYCCQCSKENQLPAQNNSQYVPVIMMPIYPADQCPFDMECEIQKIEQSEPKSTKIAKIKEQEKYDDLDKDKTIKRRGFVLQRFTDFDLLSQWYLFYLNKEDSGFIGFVIQNKPKEIYKKCCPKSLFHADGVAGTAGCSIIIRTLFSGKFNGFQLMKNGVLCELLP